MNEFDEADIDTLSVIEERADYVTEEIIKNNTVSSGLFYNRIHNALISTGIKLIVGPRGCGKTHLMRYAWVECKNDDSYPLPIYVSFNKYFKLEPLLKSKPNAIDLFHKWVLSKILLSAYDIACEIEEDNNLELSSILITDKDFLSNLINRLEQGLSPSFSQESVVENISVSAVIESIHNLCDWLERKRVIILLDDAAISLTPEYLYEFFDIVRSLKTPRIALKASVYPGTTEYGPKFHVAHDAETVDAWISSDDVNYSNIMESIALARFENYNSINKDIRELFKYAAFGIPRSFLMMLRDYEKSDGTTAQQKFNKIIEKYVELRLSEYNSLKDKLPRFAGIVNIGENLLLKSVELLKDANSNTHHEKQVILGVEKNNNTFFSRMLRLLVETGLLYRLPDISHGDARMYERYIPHYALLIKEKVFSESSRGFSPSQITSYILRKNAKHPIRRSMTSLLSSEQINNLKLTLPPCGNCNASRLTENQKYCHQCGSQLIAESAYNQCMSIPLSKIPHLTVWQTNKLAELDNLKTIGDVLSLQDPGSELRKISRIGPVKANKIITKILFHVEEYLS
ncbi:ORC-CDC6 family AAA ATPase [Pectobacterium versatile]|uniref:ORC-CDC6 family AAA ATPase n=2 Tax=Pectobacterium versatile TaxID=2488639 RepID=UPI0015DDC27F|nr:zinc ribbon domain-containing protein [Pectobacterium versatile]MBA0172637.1 zinc ribbon domain-containing protein [Pectobacterium versatile]MCA6936584.1 zinc ribbon domain-containing protein [Pectobacterium versatile]